MKKTVISGVVALVASVGCMAEPLEYPEAQGFELYEGLRLAPMLSADLLMDDNVARTHDDQIDSLVTIVSPGVLLFSKSETREYGLGYRAEAGRYLDSEEDNYVDNYLEAFIKNSLNVRNYVELSANYIDSHEARGTGFSRGLGDLLEEPDQFKRKNVTGLYRYGADGAKGRIELLGALENTDFDTALFVDNRDYDTGVASGRFIYRPGAKIDYSLELRRRSVSYNNLSNEFLGLDSVENAVLFGLAWEATAKTSGSVKVGFQEKEFDEVTRSNFSSPTWDVDIFWEPKVNHTFNLSARRDIEESRGFDDFTDVRTFSLSLISEWSDKISSTARVYTQDVDYSGLERNEKDVGADFKVSLEARRWLGFALGYSTQSVESSSEQFGFDRNVLYVQSKVAF